MLPVFNSFTISTFSILSKENSIAITTTSLPGIMLIQHPAVLSENMVSLYFFLSPQRCRISHRRQCASLLHWNLTIPPSLWPDRELRKYHCPCLALAPPPVAIRHLLLRNRYRPDGLHGVQSKARPNRNVPEE